jgi:hypothetical protein
MQLDVTGGSDAAPPVAVCSNSQWLLARVNETLRRRDAYHADVLTSDAQRGELRAQADRAAPGVRAYYASLPAKGSALLAYTLLVCQRYTALLCQATMLVHALTNGTECDPFLPLVEWLRRLDPAFVYRAGMVTVNRKSAAWRVLTSDAACFRTLWRHRVLDAHKVPQLDVLLTDYILLAENVRTATSRIFGVALDGVGSNGNDGSGSGGNDGSGGGGGGSGGGGGGGGTDGSGGGNDGSGGGGGVALDVDALLRDFDVAALFARHNLAAQLADAPDTAAEHLARALTITPYMSQTLP